MKEYISKKDLNTTPAGKSVGRAAMPETGNQEYLRAVLTGRAKADSATMGHRQDLAPSLNAKMSKAFGMDLSQVRLYRSDAMTGTGMKGLSSGGRVVLSKDVDLNTTAGQAILGHELSHVHAQSQGIGLGHTGLYNNAALEHQADREGMLAARGQSILGDSTGMETAPGMNSIGGLTPLSAGMSASAGAPMQAWLIKNFVNWIKGGNNQPAGNRAANPPINNNINASDNSSGTGENAVPVPEKMLGDENDPSADSLLLNTKRIPHHKPGMAESLEGSGFYLNNKHEGDEEDSDFPNASVNKNLRLSYSLDSKGLPHPENSKAYDRKKHPNLRPNYAPEKDPERIQRIIGLGGPEIEYSFDKDLPEEDLDIIMGLLECDNVNRDIFAKKFNNGYRFNKARFGFEAMNCYQNREKIKQYQDDNQLPDQNNDVSLFTETFNRKAQKNKDDENAFSDDAFFNYEPDNDFPVEYPTSGNFLDYSSNDAESEEELIRNIPSSGKGKSSDNRRIVEDFEEIEPVIKNKSRKH